MKQDLMDIREKVQQIIQLTGDIRFKDEKIRCKCESYRNCEKCPVHCYVGIVDYGRHTKFIRNKAKDLLETIDEVLYNSR